MSEDERTLRTLQATVAGLRAQNGALSRELAVARQAASMAPSSIEVRLQHIEAQLALVLSHLGDEAKVWPADN